MFNKDKNNINKESLLIVYNSSSLKNNEKVRFYYALKGRNGDAGIRKLYSLNFLAKGVFIAQSQDCDNIISFFTPKTEFSDIPIIPKSVIKAVLFSVI